jgi:glycine/D-amino acid oxidase-like deaminating enzyme
MTILEDLPNLPYWSARDPARAPLDRDSSVDIAIIGAGFTGLWAAFYLAQADPTLRIAIIERDHVGFGASGRNGGWTSSIFPVSLDHVAKQYGRAAAVHLQLEMNETVDEIGRVIAAEGIDAQYVKHGFLSLARSRAQLARARAMVGSSSALGLPEQWRLLGAGQAADMIDASGVLGGLFTPHCAVVHPGNLVRGLARIVERMGVAIYEGTPATSFGAGEVVAPNARLDAKIVLRATEAFTCQFKTCRRLTVPIYSFVLATEPLPIATRERLGLTRRLAFNDLRHLRIYAQLAADGRLIFGGRGAPYHFGSKISPRYDVPGRIHAKIRHSMVEMFPSLRDLRITHRWGGALAVARDWYPAVGFDRDSGIAWAGQYVGDGVATSNLAGRILRNLILGRDEPINLLPIVNHKSPQWEIEPMRWAGVNAGIALAAMGDAEERFTGRPSQCARMLESITGGH